MYEDGFENKQVVDNGTWRVNFLSTCFIQLKTRSAKAVPASVGYREPFLTMKYSPQNLHLGWWQDTILQHDDPVKRNIILHTLGQTCIKDDSQRRFLAQHSLAMLEQCCNSSKQCRNNVATLYCTKNRRCESSRVTSSLSGHPLGTAYWPLNTGLTNVRVIQENEGSQRAKYPSHDKLSSTCFYLFLGQKKKCQRTLDATHSAIRCTSMVRLLKSDR